MKSCVANDWVDCCGTTTAMRRDLRRLITAAVQEPAVIVRVGVRARPKNQGETAVSPRQLLEIGARSIDIGRNSAALPTPTIGKMRG